MMVLTSAKILALRLDQEINMTIQKYDPDNPRIVKLTEGAIGHFRNVAKDKIVRFGIKGGGCAGFQYDWGLVDTQTEDMESDEQTDYGDFVLSIDKFSIMYLMGTTVDYVSDLTGNRIDIQNPLAQAGCGCGESINFNV